MSKLKNNEDKTGKQKEIELPALNLTTFDGGSKAWKGFWELFECAVDGREDLPGIKKFTYLKGQMQGEVLLLIGGFSMEAANYEPAEELLKDTLTRRKNRERQRT